MCMYLHTQTKENNVNLVILRQSIECHRLLIYRKFKLVNWQLILNKINGSKIDYFPFLVDIHLFLKIID